jgi:hypothetical protein
MTFRRQITMHRTLVSRRLSLVLLGAIVAIGAVGGIGTHTAQAQSPNRLVSPFPDLDQKIVALLPTPEEQAFLQIPWRLNIMQARAESLRTGKPLFVWEMNGHPLGHT